MANVPPMDSQRYAERCDFTAASALACLASQHARQTHGVAIRIPRLSTSLPDRIADPAVRVRDPVSRRVHRLQYERNDRVRPIPLHRRAHRGRDRHRAFEPARLAMGKRAYLQNVLHERRHLAGRPYDADRTDPHRGAGAPPARIEIVEIPRTPQRPQTAAPRIVPRIEVHQRHRHRSSTRKSLCEHRPGNRNRMRRIVRDLSELPSRSVPVPRASQRRSQVTNQSPIGSFDRLGRVAPAGSAYGIAHRHAFEAPGRSPCVLVRIAYVGRT